jgi:hypothetical protein
MDSTQQPQPAAAPQPQDQMQAAADPMSAGAETLDDPVLKQIEQGIEQSVPAEHRKMYDSIVVAGMNVMFSKETSQMMDQQLAAQGDPVTNVADGIAKLIVIVFNESKQQPDQFAPAAGLASITLMCQALDYAEQAKGIEVTPELAAQCTKLTVTKVMEKFGISQQQLDQVVAIGQQQQGGAQPQQPEV